MKKIFLSLLLVMLNTAFANGAGAQYPSRTIQVITPLPPGGPFEITIRDTLEKLNTQTGWNFILVNKPGAGQLIASNIVAKAPPDGYTLLAAEIEYATTAPLIYNKLPFESSDLVPVSGLIRNSALFIMASISFPPNNIKELIEYARANPGKVTYGTSGPGLPFHMAMLAFSTKHNLNLVHVPFKGIQPANLSVMTGDVNLTFTGEVQGTEYLKTGKVKMIAISGDQRSIFLPTVPTSIEQGEPELTFRNHAILSAPAGTPQEIIDKLHKAVYKLQKDPEYNKTTLGRFHFSPYIRNPQEMAKEIQTIQNKHKRVLDSIQYTPAQIPN